MGSICVIEFVVVYWSVVELVVLFGGVDCDVVLVDYVIFGDE